jgi:hypothetical protein
MTLVAIFSLDELCWQSAVIRHMLGKMRTGDFYAIDRGMPVFSYEQSKNTI